MVVCPHGRQCYGEGPAGPRCPWGAGVGRPPGAGAPHAWPPWTPRQHLPLLPPAPSLQLMARDTSRLHISPDMKAPRFGGEAAVTGAKLCVSGFGDVIYYRSLGTGLRPSTHFSWATPAPKHVCRGSQHREAAPSFAHSAIWLFGYIYIFF